MRVASLYSGVGGLDWGFAKEGYEFVFANDFNEFACETYTKNFQKFFQHDCNYLKVGDISKHLDDIPEHDLLLGGFPCPAWSLAGQRKGFDDDRGAEFWNCIKVLKKNQPKVAIFENVKGLLSHGDGESIKIMHEAFDEAGYKSDHRLFSLWKYGVPQDRQRVLLVCVRKDIDIEPLDLTPEATTDRKIALREVIGALTPPDPSDEHKFYQSHNYHAGRSDNKGRWMKIIKEGENLSHLTEEEILKRVAQNGDSIEEFTAWRRAALKKRLKTDDVGSLSLKPKTLMGYFRLNYNEIAPTMWFGNTSIPIHPTQDRSISIREAALIQGFPLDFDFFGGVSHRYKQIGNAVPPIFSEVLAKHAVAILAKVFP